MAPGDSKRIRGVAAGLAKIGQLSEEDDAGQAMTYYHQALALLDSQPEADRKRVASFRLYEVLRTTIISVDIKTGHTAEAWPLIKMERDIEAQQIAIDPIDIQARTDLLDFDTCLLEAFDVVGNYREGLKAADHMLENLRFLTHLQPENESLHFRYVSALLSEGKDLIRTGKKAEGLQVASQGLDLLLPLATAPDTQPDTLDLASDSLVYLKRNPPVDAPLALSFAQRSIALSGGSPGVVQLLNLARAQRFAGQTADSRKSAEEALTSLDQTPNGVGHSADIAQAKELLSRW